MHQSELHSSGAAPRVGRPSNDLFASSGDLSIMPYRTGIPYSEHSSGDLWQGGSALLLSSGSASGGAGPAQDRVLSADSGALSIPFAWLQSSRGQESSGSA